MREKVLRLLQQRANRRGQVLARGPWLEEELGCSSPVLEAALTDLASSGVLEILSPLPWLIVKVRRAGGRVAPEPPSWSDSSPSDARKGQQISSNSRSMDIEVPVSSAAAAAMQPREVGGAGEGEALLDEVLALLGPDADRDEFRTVLAGHSRALIRRCLKRVQATRNIRVSRAALFRSLLTKLSH